MFLCDNCGLAPDRIYEGEHLPDCKRISQPNQYLLIGPKASVREVSRSDETKVLIGNVDFGVEISDRPNFDMEVWSELLLKLKRLNTGTSVVKIFEKASGEHAHTKGPVSRESFGHQFRRRSTDPRRNDHKLGVNPRTKLLKLRDPDTSDYGHKHPQESAFRRLRLTGSSVAATVFSLVNVFVGTSAFRIIHGSAFWPVMSGCCRGWPFSESVHRGKELRAGMLFREVWPESHENFDPARNTGGRTVYTLFGGVLISENTPGRLRRVLLPGVTKGIGQNFCT
jgi:hypothetical protein